MPIKGREQAGTTPEHRTCLTDWVRARAGVLLSPFVRLLARLGVHPNTLTILGFLLQAGIGGLFGLGYIRLGGLLLVLVAPLDALDGALARDQERASRFGAFLDSALDRLSDAALVIGLLVHSLYRGRSTQVILFAVALMASLLVSYIRARAESLGFQCKVGLLTRLERIALIALLTLAGWLAPLAWALAVLSVFTVVQRIAHVHRGWRASAGGSR